MPVIPDSHADLLAREKKAFAHLALVTSDGDAARDADVVRLRRRARDLQHRPQPREGPHHEEAAARRLLTVPDPANPYRYIQVRGPVVSESEEGGYDQICDLRAEVPAATGTTRRTRARCA